MAREKRVSRPEKALTLFNIQRRRRSPRAERARLSRLIEQAIEIIGREGYEKAARARRDAEKRRRRNMLAQRTEQARQRLKAATQAAP